MTLPAEPLATASLLKAVPHTPFPRLVTGMLISNLGGMIALLTPLQLLLTLHLTRIAGVDAAAAFGVVSGIGALFAVFANPLGGRLSDRTAARFGRRRTWILTGAIAGSLVIFAINFTTEVWQVIIVWALAQTAFNFQLAASNALMPDQVPEERRGTVAGLAGAVAALAPLLGLLAVSLIHNSLIQWTIVAVVALVAGIIAVILIRDPQHLQADRVPLNIVELAKSFWLNPRRHPAFGWAWITRFLITCGVAANSYQTFFLMQKLGYTEEEVGGQVLLIALLTVGLIVVASAIGGVLSDKIRRQKPFVVAAGVLAAAGMIVMAFASDVSHVFVAGALTGVGTGLFFAIDLALCVRMLPSSENAGKDLAIINMANTLPQSFVPLIAPALLALGSFPVLYLTLAVLCLLGTVAVRRLSDIGQEEDPCFAPVMRIKPTSSHPQNPVL
ncbi:MFS transporter [Amycolatopsis pigmentata]|uniref:MFS transporter n=1 Tax=Amycolatopsis pigmentata TaxID=450801 RepID=A0ABW5GCH6_9PSEU